MIEEAVTITVTRAVIDTLDDARELQDWIATNPGMYCSIVALDAGGWHIEIGGREIDGYRVDFGDTVIWDGKRFSVIKPESDEPEIQEETQEAVQEEQQTAIPAPIKSAVEEESA